MKYCDRYRYLCTCQWRREMPPREPPVVPMSTAPPPPSRQPRGRPLAGRIPYLEIHTEVAPRDLNQMAPVAESCHNATSQDAEAVTTSRGS